MGAKQTSRIGVYSNKQEIKYLLNGYIKREIPHDLCEILISYLYDPINSIILNKFEQSYINDFISILQNKWNKKLKSFELLYR